jgi:hypothetical protein
MRDLVFNETCVPGQFATLADAVQSAIDLITGLIELSRHKITSGELRLHQPPDQIVLGAGVSLGDVAIALLRSPANREEGRFFARMALKVPVDYGLPNEMIDHLLRCRSEAYPESIGLLLCALSNRIAVTLSADTVWDRDRIVVDIALESAAGESRSESREFDHVSRALHAPRIIERTRATTLHSLNPVDFWSRKGELFPHLLFGREVEKQILRCGPDVFQSAMMRLQELDFAASRWRNIGGGVPPYLSRVTGESESTMNKYGNERVFQDSNGAHATFELHARIAEGCRIHLIEHPADKAIEVGYIGPHLSTSDFPS